MKISKSQSKMKKKKNKIKAFKLSKSRSRSSQNIYKIKSNKIFGNMQKINLKQCSKVRKIKARKISMNKNWKKFKLNIPITPDLFDAKSKSTNINFLHPNDLYKQFDEKSDFYDQRMKPFKTRNNVGGPEITSN